MSVLDVVRILRTTKQADAAAQAAEAAKVARVAEQTKKVQSVQRIQVGSEVVEFPADMPDDKIKAALKKHYGPTATQQKITALEQENVALKNKPAERVEPRITASLKNKYVDDRDGASRVVFTKEDVRPEVSTTLNVELYTRGMERAWLNVPKSARWTDDFQTRIGGKLQRVTVTDGVAYKGDEFLKMLSDDLEALSDQTSILGDTEKKLWTAMANKLRVSKGINDIPFVITNSQGLKDMKAGGLYLHDGKFVLINAEALKTVAIFKMGIHEAVHAKTVGELNSGGALSRLTENLLAIAKKEAPDHPAAPVYGYSNKLEFAAEALSSPSFYERLKKIETPTGTVADRFIQAVAKVLGLGAVAIGTAEYDALEKIVAPQEVESDGA